MASDSMPSCRTSSSHATQGGQRGHAAEGESSRLVGLASFPGPNKALHLTASSVRSCVAPASGSR
jgi:hypothetical protein